MPFRFKLSETFEDGCRRIGREQIERALAQLDGGADRAVAVHETRKSLKRLRALLHLIRPALGDDAYRAENARLREIGQLLSGARDRQVLFETVGKLESSATLLRKNIANQVREALLGMNGHGNTAVEADAMKQAQGMLNEAGRRFARLRLPGKGFEVIGPGLESTYRRGRRAMRAAYPAQTAEAFHEWRKETQRHWRHMMLFSRAWIETIGARAAAAREISQVLGDDHDLAMLSSFVRSSYASGLAEDAKATIEKLASQRQRELRTLARPMGDRLFAEGAKNLRRRVGAYWEAAVELKELQPEQAEGGDTRPATPRRRRSLRANPLG
jgi:CHAD domain-containing protein